jgi:anti-anti-sigma factor
LPVASPRSVAQLQVTKVWTDRRVIIYLRGEADIATVSVLDAEIADVIGRNPHALTVDMADLSFMDCATGRILAQLRDNAAGGGCEFSIRRPTGIARIVLDHFGFDGKDHEQWWPKSGRSSTC